MNENYIIDGNAVYEIDSGCAALNTMEEAYDSKVETQMIFRRNDSSKNEENRSEEEKVSVF